MPRRLYQRQAPRARVVVIAFFDELLGDVQPAAFELVQGIRNIEVENNAARKADKCTIELDYREFPIDPRLISAIHVTVYMGSEELVGSDFGLRFIGYVDAPEVRIDRSGGTIKLECRDYTALALDKSWRRVAEEAPKSEDDKKTRIFIPTGLRLGKFVSQWYERLGISAVSLGAESEPPVVFEQAEFARLRLDRVASGSYLAMKNGDTAWDVLLQVCEWFGLLPVWKVNYRPPNGRLILGPSLAIRSAASVSATGVQFNWGYNVEELQIRRNLVGPERKQVRVVAWNPRLAQAFAADFPVSPILKTAMTVGGVPATGEAQLRRVQYNLYGDYDQALVQEIAQRVYEDQYRRRTEATVITRDMTDTGLADVIGIGNGDYLRLQIDPATVHGLDHMTPGQAEQYLSDPNRANSLPPAAARFVADNLRTMRDLSIEFYVTAARHTWDYRDGYRAEFEISDFVADIPTQGDPS